MKLSFYPNNYLTSADPDGGQGVRTPPGKSQVIWVSIGNKQLDPLENAGPPLEPCKMIDFLEIDHLTSVKQAED